MSNIILIVNPHSGKNKSNPKRIENFRKILGSAGTMIIPDSLHQLNQEIRSLKDKKTDILCIDGGDGTVHQITTALFNIYGHTPWPKIAILKGGTMNNIARNIGIPLFQGANTMLHHVIHTDSHKTVVKHPLIVDEKYAGFIYGTSGIAAYLEEYYEGNNPSIWKAAKIAIHSMLSALINGSYVRKIFASRPISIDVDGTKGKEDHYTNMGISTLTDIGFYLRPFYHTLSRPDIAHMITMNCSPLYILFSLPHMWLARPTNKTYIEDLSGQKISLTFQGQQSFTLDGDLYPIENQQQIRVGPPIHFIVGKS